MGWKMEGIINFGPNVASFLLTLRSRKWYVIGVYLPPNDALTVHCTEQAFEEAPKGIQLILLGDLNVSLREPKDSRGDEVVMALADSSMGNGTDHFMPRRRYKWRGVGRGRKGENADR